MNLEEKQALLRVIHYVECHTYMRLETLRHLAGTEEHYRRIVREIDRVKSQLTHARVLGATATLTIREWFAVLDQFEWKCAYCQQKPFQILSHKVMQARAGTTAENCVPACYRCVNSHRLPGPAFRQIQVPPPLGHHEACEKEAKQ